MVAARVMVTVIRTTIMRTSKQRHPCLHHLVLQIARPRALASLSLAGGAPYVKCGMVFWPPLANSRPLIHGLPSFFDFMACDRAT